MWRIPFTFILYSLVLLSCSSKELKFSEEVSHDAVKEYDKMVKVKELAPEPSPKEPSIEQKGQKPPPPVIEPLARDKKRDKEKKKGEVTMVSPQKREPPTEDSEGFAGRRPLVDPFRVGEKVSLALTYFNMAAGYLNLEVLPFAEVNGKKAYHFLITVESSKVFSYFYAVEDRAETYLDFEMLTPYTLSIKTKESKILKDTKIFFDWDKKTANWWETKVTKEKGEQNRKLTWAIESYTQNVISAIFYLRIFNLTPGKKLAMRVADDGKNIVFKAEVIRREKITTEAGEFNTVVVKPEFHIDGKYKPVGDIFLWFTEDERKLLVQIQTKIKIGSIVGKLKSVQL